MAYPGGKGGAGVAQTIINQMPPHDVYCEPFLGGGSVMLAKRPALENIGIDRNRSSIATFDDVAGDLPGARIISDGVQYMFDRQWRTRDLIYCDPPYLREARRSPRRIYRYEMTTPDHERFLTVAKMQPCLVMISGYRCALYDAELADWRRVDFQAMTRGGVATESLWCNFPEPAALHDYRFLGDDFRERERIKRKAARWRRKWAALPMLERRAIMAGISDAAGSSAGSYRQF